MFRLKPFWDRFERLLNCRIFLGCTLILFSGCLQADFGGPKKSSSSALVESEEPSLQRSGPGTAPNEWTDEKVQEFQTTYPEFGARKLQAFSRTIHPLLMKSCGGCHSEASSSNAKSVPHSDPNIDKAYPTAIARGLFDFQTPPSSRVFHMRAGHLGYADFASLSDPPVKNALDAVNSVWVRAIANYSLLVGNEPQKTMTDPVIISQADYEVLRTTSATVECEYPRSTACTSMAPGAGATGSWISLTEFVSNGSGGSERVEMRFSLKVIGGFYYLSKLKLKTNVVLNDLEIGGIHLVLNGQKISTASAFRPATPYRVGVTSVSDERVFTGDSEAVFAGQIEKSRCDMGEKERCQDQIAFEVEGMKWIAKTSVPGGPSPARNQTQRLADALEVLTRRCSGCHGLGSTSGGVFPGIVANAFSVPTDAAGVAAAQAAWVAARGAPRRAWIVSENPTNSLLMQRLQLVTDGGPPNPAVAGLSQNMPQGQVALSRRDVWVLNDWIALMGSADVRTLRFEIPPDASNASTDMNWTSPLSPIRLTVGDTLFVRNLGNGERRVHTESNRPFAHQSNGTTACGANVPCGFTRFLIQNSANSIANPASGVLSDTVYDHNARSLAPSKPGLIHILASP